MKVPTASSGYMCFLHLLELVDGMLSLLCHDGSRSLRRCFPPAHSTSLSQDMLGIASRHYWNYREFSEVRDLSSRQVVPGAFFPVSIPPQNNLGTSATDPFIDGQMEAQ